MNRVYAMYLICIERELSCVNCILLQLPTYSSGDSGRERIKQFTYDHSYWSVNKNDPRYASQAQVCVLSQ